MLNEGWRVCPFQHCLLTSNEEDLIARTWDNCATLLYIVAICRGVGIFRPWYDSQFVIAEPCTVTLARVRPFSPMWVVLAQNGFHCFHIVCAAAGKAACGTRRRGPTGLTWGVLALNRIHCLQHRVCCDRKGLLRHKNGRVPLAERGLCWH